MNIKIKYLRVSQADPVQLPEHEHNPLSHVPLPLQSSLHRISSEKFKQTIDKINLNPIKKK